MQKVLLTFPEPKENLFACKNTVTQKLYGRLIRIQEIDARGKQRWFLMTFLSLIPIHTII